MCVCVCVASGLDPLLSFLPARHTSTTLTTLARRCATAQAGRPDGKPFILLPDLNVYIRHRTVFSPNPYEYLLPVHFMPVGAYDCGTHYSGVRWYVPSRSPPLKHSV